MRFKITEICIEIGKVHNARPQTLQYVPTNVDVKQFVNFDRPPSLLQIMATRMHRYIKTCMFKLPCCLI